MASACNYNYEDHDGHCVNVQSNPLVMLIIFYILYISKDSISDFICKSKKMMCSNLKYIWNKMMATATLAYDFVFGFSLYLILEFYTYKNKMQCIWKSLMATLTKHCISEPAKRNTENKCEEPVEEVEKETIKCEKEPDQSSKEEHEKVGHVVEDTIEHACEEVMKFGQRVKEKMDKACSEIKEGFEDIAESVKDTIVTPVTDGVAKVKAEIQGFDGIANLNIEGEEQVKCDPSENGKIIPIQTCEDQMEVVEDIKCDIENIKCDIETIKSDIENIKIEITQCDPEPKCKE